MDFNKMLKEELKRRIKGLENENLQASKKPRLNEVGIAYRSGEIYGYSAVLKMLQREVK